MTIRSPGASGRRLAAIVASLLVGSAFALPASAASAFDGTYTGVQTEAKSNGTAECSHLNLDRTSITIRDGHFTRKWVVDIPVDVNPDGTFKADAALTGGRIRAAEISGKIAGNKLEAEIGTMYCGAHLSLTKP